jgi:hypothetical protein
MAFSINCQACNRRYCLDQELFERRVAGKISRFKCPSCGAASAIDALMEESLQPLASSAEEREPRLHESDFAAEQTEIAELTDDEVASLPPESLKPAARKPVPRPRLESKIDDELWVVSAREEVDDQEIFESSLIHQIAEGKMPPDAIVWREGMQDWLPLADVPDLAKHLPVADDKTGGFLGTGIRATFGSNSGERKSAPPPLPPKKRSYGSAKKKSGGHKSGEARGTKPVALSPGFLFSVDDTESEPPTPSAEQTKPVKGIPKPPLRGPRRAVTRDLDFSDIAEEEEPPRSGTPGLSQLTTETRGQRRESATTNPLFAGLGGDEEQVLGPPSIDISDLVGGMKSRARSRDHVPESERGQANEESRSKQSGAPSGAPSDRLGKKRRKSERPRSSKRPSTRPAVGESRSRSASTSRAGASASEAPPSGPRRAQQRWLNPARIMVLLVLAALAYLMFSRQMRQVDEPTQAPNAQAESPEPAPPLEQEAEVPVVDQPRGAESTEGEPADASEPTPEAVGAPRSTPRAQQQPAAPARQTEPPSAVEPTAAPEQARPAAAPQAAPKPQPAPKSNQDAPPFDKSAAAAAMDAVVAQASGCRQEGDPTGTARVVVTFAPSGRVTSANLSGPPFAGTRTGGCIASTMRRAKVPPFSGDHVTVAKSVVIR